jgi:hypothetical protein
MASLGRFWPTRAQLRRRHRLMRRMMRTSGVQADAAARVDGGLALREARAKCRYCLHEEACRIWLASAEGLQVPPDFCPNVRFFRSCRIIDH